MMIGSFSRFFLLLSFLLQVDVQLILFYPVCAGAAQMLHA